jgi:uncharacterized membrane protein
MITLEHAYIVGGFFFAAIAILSALDHANDRRIRNALFWALLAVSFWGGGLIGDLGNGVLALGLVALAALGLGQGKPKTTTPEERRESAERRGNFLFLPALIIPAVALAGTLLVQHTEWGPLIIQDQHKTLIALTIGVLIAIAVIMLWLKPSALAPLQEGRRLMDSVGWAAILPQMLASLGAVFLVSGVGDQVGRIFAEYIPLDTRTIAVAAYCIGMALFTIIMGNAFAAFPVMTAAVGLPVLINTLGGDPARICAIGMLAGFCGTLMTPMAANFNLVPVALLELDDPYAVIRAQVPTGLVLLAANVVLMYFIAFR